ncbi:MAG: lipopolysaccharide kinase InaA family protein [Porticoccus sp.]|uniref:lipopolysaccharide kinase InaA family protein n=1 Tax=Porticoccus sp. TaxID=2024853 RepID=UPI0032990693
MKAQFFQLEPTFVALFESLNLDHFSAWWNVAIERVDEPNLTRGGRSEVGQLSIPVSGQRQTFYLKRQANYNCRTPGSPLRGIPVALREWQKINWLKKQGIETLEVVCVGRESLSEDRAILATAALEQFSPFDVWLARPMPDRERAKGLRALGQLIGRLHAAGVKHGCLYAKHIYFSDHDSAELRLIDLEKCKRIFSRWAGLRDLDTLLRHSPSLAQDERRLLYAAYNEASPFPWSLASLEQAVMRRMHAKGAVRDD